MRLFIVGCVLFLIGIGIDASAKTKITKHVTTTKNRDTKTPSGCATDIQTSKNYCFNKLPYDGGILNAKGEYISGMQSALDHFYSRFSEYNGNFLIFFQFLL